MSGRLATSCPRKRRCYDWVRCDARYNLVPHPSTRRPRSRPFKVWANVEHAGALGAVATTNIWFGVGAPAARFVIPEAAEPARADELWKTTCFEAFLRPHGERGLSRVEFRAVGRMGGVRFHRLPRRHDATPRSRRPVHPDGGQFHLVGARRDDRRRRRPNWELGLSAVLEEKDGTKSYWALAHPTAKSPISTTPIASPRSLP